MRNQQHAAIQHRLWPQIILLIVVVSMPIIAFGGYLMLRVNDAQEAAVERELFRQSNALSAALDQLAIQQIRVLQTLAGSAELDDQVNYRDLRQFYNDAQRAQVNNPEWVGLALINPQTGRQVLNTVQVFGVDLPVAGHLESVKQVATTRRPQIIAEAAARGAISGEPIVGVRVPVIRDDEVRYVLSVLLRISVLQETLAAHKVPEKWTVAVLDDEANIIARNRRSYEFVGRRATDDLRTAIARGDQGIFRATTQEGEPVYTVFQRSSLTHWVVALGVPAADIDPLRWGAAGGLLGSGLISISVAGLMAFLLGRMFVARREARERQQRLQETERALAEKDVLLREIHHRVKNNLQMMASMVRIIARGPLPDPVSAFRDVTRRIEALGAAYNEIHNAEDLKRLDLAKYIEQISFKAGAALATDEIRLHTRLEPINTDIDTALPVGLVANELVTNAYKHGFPNGGNGEIVVCLERRRPPVAVLTVADTGIGLAGSASVGSMGLTLAKALAQQVNGRLYATAGPRGGARFRLVFKLVRDRIAG